MTAIEINDLHKSFGDLHVLRGIDLTVDGGECVILLGANGCGKSTLMRCLNGLARPDRGQVSIFATDVAQARGRRLRAIRTRLGVVFQHFNLVPNASAFQNVLYGALGRQRGGLLRTLPALAPADLRARAMACLDRVGLASHAGYDARQLSGGQQQRVAIARALLQEPDVLLADEPVASLDPRAGRAVMELLLEIARERGMTVLCSLHQLELACEYGDRIVGMKAGRIELDAPRTQVERATMSDLYEGVVRVDDARATDEAPVRIARSA
ncbi:MAG: phosphonate ABC transporter ATP-binding protein [Halofilum sp. (in: g-proteobacteria)]